jgi:hypothetical protein
MTAPPVVQPRHCAVRIGNTKAIYQSGGLVGFMLEVDGYPKPNWTALIEEGNRIAREEIKGWLGTIFCANTSLEDLYTNLEDLYRDINFIRVTVTSGQALPKSYPFKRVQTALKALEKDLPDLIAELHGLILSEAAGREARRIRNETFLIEVQMFSEAVARMRVNVPDDIPPVHHKFQAWHDDALFLARSIQQISGGEGSLKSMSSPLINFITKALDRAVPLSSGRERTEDALRQALANHPQRALLGFA